MKLTEEQKKAMTHYKGPALIIAVPGAGKTTVLLERIKYLTKNKKVNPKRILSITFSKQQALDMKERFGQNPTHFSTIHAFCYSLIRYHQKINGRQLRLIEEQGFSKHTVIRRLYMEFYRRHIADDELDKFFRHYGYLKNTLLSPEQMDEPIHGFRKLYDAYGKYKEDHHYFDFDDMLTIAHDLLEESSFLKKIQDSYDFIQVDEGQDTSKIQVEIIKKIALPKNNLFIVADDDQSIYSFRGAEPDYLLDFKKHYPQGKIYFIEENHRSSEDIIEASNRIIGANKRRYQKKIITRNKKNSPVAVHPVENLREEYDTLAKLLEKSPGKSIGILYRNNITALGLGNYFLEKGIDFYIPRYRLDYLNFFVLEDLKDIIYFSEHPNDLSVFSRIYYKLNAYIKKTMIHMLPTYDEGMKIFDRLLDNPNLSDFYVDKFLALKESFSQMGKEDIPQRMERILEEVGYRHFIEERVNLESKSLSYDLLVEIYLEIFRDIPDYESMLLHLDKLRFGLQNHSRIEKPIVLSTVHGSKGLEYDEVYLLDLVDGEFPLHYQKDYQEEDLFYEEERRLFYVAMTRAREKLHFILPKKRNGFSVPPSRYVEELSDLSSRD